jgi:hypothetical protein
VRPLGLLPNVNPILLAHVVVDLHRAGVQGVLPVLPRSRDPILLPRSLVEVARLVAASAKRGERVSLVIERAPRLTASPSQSARCRKGRSRAGCT